jgi:thymidylate synthase (FAD)
MTKILDHGYVNLIETWGSDESIVEAARMSTARGFLGWGGKDKPGDEKLLKFLWDNRHASPFEMAGAVFEVKAPIFVFREWHRHRTQSYNEMSARYIPLPDENYIPTVERLLISSTTNKQAGSVKGSAGMDAAAAGVYIEALKGNYTEAQRFYQSSLDAGVPKELARIHLPVGRYSCMRASANLRNWLAFLTLRMAPNAQWEIRQFANAVGEALSDAFPRTYDLFSSKEST